MTKIADGYFYDVYDIGNDKVVKVQRPLLAVARSIKGKTSMSFATALLKALWFTSASKRITRAVRKRLTSIPKELFGNPYFLNETDYKQDKVVLLMDYFEGHSLEENRLMVNKYIDLVLELLRYGIHDTTYKFKNSYGVDDAGNVICIDFNEATFSKNKTLELVRNKRWQSEAQYRKFEEGQLKTYLGDQLTKKLSPQTVEDLWNTWSN